MLADLTDEIKSLVSKVKRLQGARSYLDMIKLSTSIRTSILARLHSIATSALIALVLGNFFYTFVGLFDNIVYEEFCQ